ncbi:MAG: transposase, partial [Deltaproteobacteria bacterium]|nr:transposase [Deltaproteobacteria bacterium]
IFFDGTVLLGREDSKTQEPLRMVEYRVGGITYYVVTDRMDLTAEEVATVYKLRWEIEKFFAWWKKRLNVYHLISRSTYGVMVQIFAGLITYLLMAIYCAEEHGEWVNMKRVRELRNTIQNELRSSQMETTNFNKQKRRKKTVTCKNLTGNY